MIIGKALLKLASNSTSSVIRCIMTPIKALNSIIKAHSFTSDKKPVAKIIGNPTYMIAILSLLIH